jgi:hypothetical protein
MGEVEAGVVDEHLDVLGEVAGAGVAEGLVEVAGIDRWDLRQTTK